MELTTFYAIVSATGFTLVGLWWSAIDRRRDLLADPHTRRLAGGVYLTFLLPGLMGLFAQVQPDGSTVWRLSFGLTAIVGAVSTLRLISADRVDTAHGADRVGATPGPFSRHRWLVALLYAVILIIGIAPAVPGALGLTGLQGAAIAVICLVVIAHGLAWELLADQPPMPETTSTPRTPRPPRTPPTSAQP